MSSSDWMQRFSQNGVPIYVNTRTNKTTRIHPTLAKLLEGTRSYSNVRYAAYRMALKFRYLQTSLCLDRVFIDAVVSALTILSSHRKFVPISVVSSFLCHIYSSIDHLNNSKVKRDSLLSLVIILLDTARNGVVLRKSLITFAFLLCSGSLMDRYRFIYLNIFDQQAPLKMGNLRILLKLSASLAQLLGESESFGAQLISASFRSFLIHVYAESPVFQEERFFSWLLLEPQMLMWLSTVYRHSASRHITHNITCTSCRASPLRGMCYICFQCINFYICENCFLYGHTGKGHKLHHAVQEFCRPWTQTEKTLVLIKILWNKLIRKRKSLSRPALLPPVLPVLTLESSQSQISPLRTFPSTTDLGSEVYAYTGHNAKYAELMSRTVLDGTVGCVSEVYNILNNLEKESDHINKQIHQFSAKDSCGKQILSLTSSQMNIQLQKLRTLLSSGILHKPLQVKSAANLRDVFSHSTPLSQINRHDYVLVSGDRAEESSGVSEANVSICKNVERDQNIVDQLLDVIRELDCLCHGETSIKTSSESGISA